MRLRFSPFGHSFDKLNSKFNYNTQIPYSYTKIEAFLSSFLGHFFENNKKNFLRQLYPASLYYLWKNFVWHNIYYSNLPSSFRFVRHNIKSVPRLTARYGNLFDLLLSLTWSFLSIPFTFYTLLRLRGDFSLVYCIGNTPSKNLSFFLNSKLDADTHFIYIVPFSLKNLKSFFLRRNLIFRFSIPKYLDKFSLTLNLYIYLYFLYFESRFFSSLLHRRPSAFYSDDDPSRVFSFLLYAKSVNLKTVAVQHGVYSRFEFGYFSKISNCNLPTYWWFDELYVSNQLWSNILEDISADPPDIKLLSQPKSTLLFQQASFTDSSLFVVVLDSYADISAVIKAISYIKRVCHKPTFCIRPHPSFTEEDIIQIKNFLGVSNVDFSLSHELTYICFKSTFSLHLIDNGYRVIFFECCLSYISDYLFHLGVSPIQI